MIHYEQWSKDCHTWIFATRHGFDELRNEAWTACKIQVYEVLGKQDGVRKLFDQGLSLDALSIVVSELAKSYCAINGNQQAPGATASPAASRSRATLPTFKYPEDETRQGRKRDTQPY